MIFPCTVRKTAAEVNVTPSLHCKPQNNFRENLGAAAQSFDMDYLVEPMSVGDFDKVLQLWRNTEGIGLNESDTRSELQKYLHRNKGLSLVARSSELL